MKAVWIERHGGPDVLQYDDVPQPSPGANQALVRVRVAGVNFIDIYQRTGLYKVDLPFILGQEAAGEIVGTGERVAWAGPQGAYAEYAAVEKEKLVPIPSGIDFDTAAAVMLQGMTAHYLATSTFPLRAGDVALVYAAAGGVGLLLTQIAKLRGATVIGITSTGEKAATARAAGADHVIINAPSRPVDLPEEVKVVTGGRGVDVAYDSVGKATWESSLRAVRRRGMLVSYGNSSGPVGEIDPLVLSARGSLYLTRPMLAHYTASREELLQRSGDLFKWIAEGKLKVRIDRAVPLAQAGDAQRALESRHTSGKVLLIP